MRILRAGGKEGGGCALREASVSFFPCSVWVSFCPSLFSPPFCSDCSFHQPHTLLPSPSPAPLQATVVMTRSRVGGRWKDGLVLSACEHRSLLAFIPVSCDQDLPVSLVWGPHGSPGTLCGQLVGRNSPSEPFLHLLFLKHHQFKSTDQDGMFWGDVS